MHCYHSIHRPHAVFFLQYQQYFLLISCLRLDPFVCITFSSHLSSGSFSLKQFLSLFLCVMFMRALESTTVTVWEAGWPSAYTRWLFSHDQTHVVKSWQESYQNGGGNSMHYLWLIVVPSLEMWTLFTFPCWYLPSFPTTFSLFFPF